jgi:natural product precursor
MKFKKLKLNKATITALDKKSLANVIGGDYCKPYTNSSGIALCSANPMGCGGYSSC